MKTKLLSREEQQAIINERDLLFLSMSSLVSGNVEWFRGSCGYSVGLCRENAPCSGLPVATIRARCGQSEMQFCTFSK